MPRWERPTKDLPPFRLSDIDGKVWYLKRLEGKALLVCVWATWSGPCHMMLPKFQEMYAKLQQRDDLTVVTMNVDEDTTQIRPFLEKHGYTFPVIPASTFVGQLVGFLSVPRLWIVDKKGKWLWEMVGYDSNADDYEEEVQRQLGLAVQEAASGT
jgi:peroxiredoxin